MVKEEFFNEMEWFLEFYDHKLTDVQSKVWFEIFRPLKKEPFHTALIWHLREDEYTNFPAPGKITLKIKELYSYTDDTLDKEIFDRKEVIENISEPSFT
jgi:hypothetical protein